MKIKHNSNFNIELTNNAYISEFKTDGNSTTIVIVEPKDEELFKTENSFHIEEILITNSQEIINVSIPVNFELNNPYPNPFNSLTNIKYSLPIDSDVTLKVYNLLGKEISTLINQNIKAGYHSIVWDADNFSSGVYFVKLTTKEFSQTQKIILIK